MARIRTIKPEFTQDEELSALSSDTHLFAAGLLCQSDDEGYFNSNPGLLKAAIFPLRETSVSVPVMLSELSRMGFIRLGHSADGKLWGQVSNFSIHQKINRPTPSKIKKLQINWDDSVTIPGLLSEPSLPERKGKEHGKEEELKPSAKQVRGPKSPDMVLPVDSRHVRIKSLICNAYYEQTQLDCPWGKPEGAQLKRFLDENPTWLDSQIAQCLVNMYASSGFPKGKRPAQFLPRLTEYVHGPLNEFNREKGNEYVNKGEQRQSASNDAIKTALKRMAGKDFGESEGSLSLPGYDGGNGRDLLAGNGNAGGRSRAATVGGSGTEVIAGMPNVPLNRGNPGQGSGHGK